MACLTTTTDDPNDPQGGMYDVDDESTIITLADWYQKPAEALLGSLGLSDVVLRSDPGFLKLHGAVPMAASLSLIPVSSTVSVDSRADLL